VSALRARCPDCRTLTAVAIGPDYQCHACGREFAAGLVRVGDVRLELPWPEAAAVEPFEEIGGNLPQRPIVVASSAEAHDAVLEELARRQPTLTVVRAGEPAGDGPVYVAVNGPADADLEALLASMPVPWGAGFAGFDDGETVARLGHALGL
jgi:hypothetical protein